MYSIVGAVVFFWRLGATGLVSMEGLVVDGARQMLESGQWVVPRVYGEIYTYKPALSYWLASLPLRLVESPSEAWLRFPFAASGFVMGLAVLILIGRAAGFRAGLLSAIASTTGVLFLQKARMLEFDSALAAGVGVAVAAACFNLSASRQRWGVWLLGYAALAAGFLAKGVPALAIFGPGIVAAALASGRFGRLFGWRHLSAVLVFVAISGSYLWSAWEVAGPAAFEQPLVEARVRGLGRLSEEDLAALPEASRFTTPEDGWPQGWPGRLSRAVVKPVMIWLAFLPWSILLLFAFRRRAAPEPDALRRLGRGAAGFVAAGALVLMLTPTHETRYFLPLSVPIGILCGLTADRLLECERHKLRGVIGCAIGVAAVVAVATVLMAFGFPSPPMPQAHRLGLVVAGVAGGAASFYLLRWRGRYRLLLILGIAALCAMLTQYLGVEPYRASKRNQKLQAQALARHIPADAPVWVLGPADEAGKHASLFFYLDRPIRAFRPERGLPAAGAHCVFTAQDLDELKDTPDFRFRETSRSEHVWWSYRVGICSEAG